MEKKTKKNEVQPPLIDRFRKICGSYRLKYTIIVCLSIVAVIAIWYFISLFWGVISLLFGVWSLCWYEDGARENCVDEWEDAYPEDGLRRMFCSWPWCAALVALIYFFCKIYMPNLFE